uniref:Uncharacterized protein n=1 Tax=Arundo donax TaxID=35708 RepID=A0A0A8ZAD9_ARUDO
MHEVEPALRAILGLLRERSTSLLADETGVAEPLLVSLDLAPALPPRVTSRLRMCRMNSLDERSSRDPSSAAAAHLRSSLH